MQLNSCLVLLLLKMDESTALIYGLELQARALCPQYGEANEVRFLIATNSLKPTNQVHLVEYNEENSNIQAKIFEHEMGDVWKITASHQNSRLLATCYNSIQGAQVSTRAALFTLPECLEEEEITSEYMSWENVHKLDTHKYGDKVKTVEFHPTQAQTMAIVVDGKVVILNCGEAKARISAELSPNAPAKSSLSSNFTSGKWSHHHQGNQFIVLHETSVRSYDIRDTQHYAWCIEDAHSQLVHDVDCNPNKQCHIVTGGDDGCVKVWDCRMPREPVYMRNDHAHWVWCVRFNTFHDQLILSSSSDNKVLLTCAGSVSSETEATQDLSLDVSLSSGTALEERSHILPDGLLQTFDQHEDSVYCVEWSSVDPWIFASLSYDGRLLITKVPKQFKYQIISI